MRLFDRSDMEPIERRLWTALAIVSALLFACAGWMIREARQPVQELAAQPVVAAAPTAALPAPAVAALPPPVLGDASPASLAAKAAATGQQLIEICGGKPVFVDPGASTAKKQSLIDEALAKAMPVPWGAMQRNQDELVQAVGHAMASDSISLVKLAMRTKDPMVYTLAKATCRPVSVASSTSSNGRWCAELSAAKRVALEPDNGAAWLEVVSEGQQLGDTAMVDEALRRIAQATRFIDHELTAPEQALRRHLETPTPATRARSEPSPWTVAVAGAYGPVAPLGFNKACGSPDALAPDRKAVCGEAALALAQRSSEPSHRQLGARVAQNLGLPGADWEAQQQLAQALMTLDVHRKSTELHQAYRCESLERQRAHLAAVREQGAWNHMLQQAMMRFGTVDAIIAESERLLESARPSSENLPTAQAR